MSESENDSPKKYPWTELQAAVKISIGGLYNFTTKSEISVSEVTDIYETSLVLELPIRSCKSGHQLTGEFIGRGLRDLVDFSVTLKVQSVLEVDEVVSQVECTFLEFDESAWSVLRSLVAQRQASVTKLFETLRGFES